MRQSRALSPSRQFLTSLLLFLRSPTPIKPFLHPPSFHSPKPLHQSSSSSSSSEEETTKPSSITTTSPRLIIGINKYTHDTCLCCADAKTGNVLYNLEYERLSRKKHDAGSTSLLLQNCLDYLDATVSDVDTVVVNNHHHRVLPLEDDVRQVEWEEGLGVNYADASEENLLSSSSSVRKVEVSHHLSHAFSAAAQAPFDEGLVVVMDGMGETYRTMRRGMMDDGERYKCDLEFGFESVPKDIEERVKESVWDWREGESVYSFTKGDDGLDVKPIFKRWIEEKTPPALHNHGFDNMESVGAVYSRVSSHIFGDWNVCGKVMGLSPWAQYSWPDVKNETHKVKVPLMEGHLYDEDGLVINWDNLRGQPLSSKRIYHPETGVPIKKYDFDYEKTPNDIALEAISLAASVQADLETVVLDFIQHFQQKTKQNNLCFVGGVAQNSVLNGRIVRELAFDRVFIPPYPGDEGIAVGCCAYGLFGATTTSRAATPPPPSPAVWKHPLPAYLGPLYPPIEITALLSSYAPWIETDVIYDQASLHETIAREISSGTVVALYRSRSESGPRALGHRSILADPRKKKAIEYVNELKRREGFRPFAPSILEEHADEWFDLGGGTNESPYMSLTAMVREEKRHLIPAVLHVDGSSRLQTVSKKDNPLYHALISAFYKETGIPLVLNTSFNTLPGEPIVETPQDALRSFISTMNAIEILVMEDTIIKRKEADIASLLGEKKASKGGLITPPSLPRRVGPVQYRTDCTISDEGAVADVVTTMVRMPDRIMHCETMEGAGWFELLDEFEGEILGCCDGTVAVEDMMREWETAEETEDKGKEGKEKGQFDQNLFENLIRRLVRLYEYTFISW